MNEISVLASALAAGVGFGLIYFWGLWMTVKTIPRTRHPALLVFASFGLRAAICVLGFYIASGGRWERLLAAILGFVAVRTVLIRCYGVGGEAAAFVKDRNHGDIAG